MLKLFRYYTNKIIGKYFIYNYQEIVGHILEVAVKGDHSFDYNLSFFFRIISNFVEFWKANQTIIYINNVMYSFPWCMSHTPEMSGK